MTAADERVLQLLQKWQKSLDMHSRYTGLTDDQYWLVQPWPNHQRPTRWVIDLARQRLAELQRIVGARLASGDDSLTEALELMSFLTNLVGSQNIERFVPVAEPERERPIEALSISESVKPARAPAAPRKSAATGKPAATGKAEASGATAGDQTRAAEIVKDAARLLSWGRKWHELPEAISRMAGRPDISQVRKILRSQRSAVESKAAELPVRAD